MCENIQKTGKPSGKDKLVLFTAGGKQLKGNKV